MTKPHTPKDGDFASELERRNKCRAAAPAPGASPAAEPAGKKSRQTIEQVLIEGEEPTEEFLEEWNALENAPDLSDEEFARQALEAGGDDDDPRTPE